MAALAACNLVAVSATVSNSGLHSDATSCSPKVTSQGPFGYCAVRRFSYGERRFTLRTTAVAGDDNVVVESAAATSQPLNGSPSTEVEKPKIIRRKKAPADDAAMADNLQMRAVEEKGVSVEGVARIDRSSQGSIVPALRIAGLAAGDLAAIVLFAWIGRATHVSTAVDFELLKTADPFIAGWAAAAYFVGDYNPDKEPAKGLKTAALTATKTWAIGVPVGIAIRSAIKGQLPALPFVGVSLASTFVLLVGWRTALAALTSKGEDGEAGEGDKKGNPLEFLELLTSLVRRW